MTDDGGYLEGLRRGRGRGQRGRGGGPRGGGHRGFRQEMTLDPSSSVGNWKWREPRNNGGGDAGGSSTVSSAAPAVEKREAPKKAYFGICSLPPMVNPFEADKSKGEDESQKVVPAAPPPAPEPEDDDDEPRTNLHLETMAWIQQCLDERNLITDEWRRPIEAEQRLNARKDRPGQEEAWRRYSEAIVNSRPSQHIPRPENPITLAAAVETEDDENLELYPEFGGKNYDVL